MEVLVEFIVVVFLNYPVVEFMDLVLGFGISGTFRPSTISGWVSKNFSKPPERR